MPVMSIVMRVKLNKYNATWENSIKQEQHHFVARPCLATICVTPASHCHIKSQWSLKKYWWQKAISLLKQVNFAIMTLRSNSILRTHFLLMVLNGCRAARFLCCHFSASSHETWHSWWQPSFSCVLQLQTWESPTPNSLTPWKANCEGLSNLSLHFSFNRPSKSFLSCYDPYGVTRAMTGTGWAPADSGKEAVWSMSGKLQPCSEGPRVSLRWPELSSTQKPNMSLHLAALGLN